jgi:hypothetical protein
MDRMSLTCQLWEVDKAVQGLAQSKKLLFVERGKMEGRLGLKQICRRRKLDGPAAG